MIQYPVHESTGVAVSPNSQLYYQPARQPAKALAILSLESRQRSSLAAHSLRIRAFALRQQDGQDVVDLHAQMFVGGMATAGVAYMTVDLGHG